MDKIVIGIDIGGTKIAVVFATSAGRILDKQILKTKVHGAARESVTDIIDVIKTYMHTKKIRRKNIRGIGVGIPGPIGNKPGIIKDAPNLPGWSGLNIARVLKDAFQCPVICNNDANAACLGEKKFGIGEKAHTFVYVTVSTGIGCGIYVNESLLMGADNNAGELGHLVIVTGGLECSCGKKGCLEAYASGAAIARCAQRISQSKSALGIYKKEFVYQVYKKRQPTFTLRRSAAILKEVKSKTKEITAYSVYCAAKKGDRVAQYLIWRSGYYFGVGLASLMQLINPDVIALGGSVINAGTLYVSPMRHAVKKYAWSSVRENCIIKKAKLGTHVGDYGTLCLVNEGNSK